jgi:tartronate-semialdehyde synthase
MAEHRVPVVVEFMLERITNVSMGAELNAVNEFEEILCLDPSLGPDGLPRADGAKEPALTPAE